MYLINDVSRVVNLSQKRIRKYELVGRLAWGLRLAQCPRPTGRRTARALYLPEPPTQGCRYPGPAPRSTPGRSTPIEDRHGRGPEKRVVIFRFYVSGMGQALPR
ncbi:hypothetical protein DFAR_3740028 [Desulfarculales bacterium]